MSYIDIQFVTTISSNLSKFSQKKKGLYNFRCPYCGDSQKHKNKARGYFFEVKNDLVFKCHNCSVGRSFGVFLKENFPHVYDEYVMEKYKSGQTGKGRYVANPDVNFNKPSFKKKTKINLDSIASLNNSHPARGYLMGRGIREDAYKDLYYCPKFKAWTNSLKETFPDTKNDDERIIIPFWDEAGELFGFQGRSLDPNSKMRYITIMLDEDHPKIYGLNRIDKDKTVYIVEGPLDATFIQNAVAMAGSDVDVSVYNWKDFVWVFDNEPRNRQIVEKIDRAAKRGDKVVIWPSTVMEKDINDMTNAGHNVSDMLESNVYQGLEATLKLNDWKRV